MILIYSTYQSVRLTYVLDFFFKSKGVKYELTNDKTFFKNYSKTKINYSNLNLDCEVNIAQDKLLFEKDISKQINISFNNNKWLINSKNDDFALVFFFLTCYEEYYIAERDKHDRFSSKHSTLSKFNRLHKPNCDLIVKQLWQNIGLDYSIVLNQYKETITFDIDMAWAYQNKSFWRNLGSDLKSILKGDSIKEKKLVRQGKHKDPFNTFDYIKEIAENNDVICFVLLGDWGRYDKNINWKNKKFNDLIKSLNKVCKVGIHPSYKSYLNNDLVTKEINRLNTILNCKTVLNRQHFLRLKLPQSYQILLKNSIKSDYSMGFADAFGFRSGTCFSYNFFDLSTNTKTDLIIYPITYMDGTLNQYLKLTPEKSINIIQQLKNEVKNVGGHFIPLWHNETISETGIWKNWLPVFKSNFE